VELKPALQLSGSRLLPAQEEEENKNKKTSRRLSPRHDRKIVRGVSFGRKAIG
jgi:hypothetical protein